MTALKHHQHHGIITFSNKDQTRYILSLDQDDHPWLYDVEQDIHQKFEHADELIDFMETGDFEHWRINEPFGKAINIFKPLVNRSLGKLLMFIVNDYLDGQDVNVAQLDEDGFDEIEYDRFDEIYGYIGYDPCIAEMFKRLNIQCTSDLMDWFDRTSDSMLMD